MAFRQAMREGGCVHLFSTEREFLTELCDKLSFMF